MNVFHEMVLVYSVGKVGMSGPGYIVGILALILVVLVLAVVRAKKSGNNKDICDEQIKVRSFSVETLTVDAENAVDRAWSALIKAEAKKVYEAIRYSDPMSNKELAPIEEQIMLQFEEYMGAVTEDNVEKTRLTARELIVLIKERNEKCQLLK